MGEVGIPSIKIDFNNFHRKLSNTQMKSETNRNKAQFDDNLEDIDYMAKTRNNVSTTPSNVHLKRNKGQSDIGIQVKRYGDYLSHFKNEAQRTNHYVPVSPFSRNISSSTNNSKSNSKSKDFILQNELKLSEDEMFSSLFSLRNLQGNSDNFGNRFIHTTAQNNSSNSPSLRKPINPIRKRIENTADNHTERFRKDNMTPALRHFKPVPQFSSKHELDIQANKESTLKIQKKEIKDNTNISINENHNIEENLQSEDYYYEDSNEADIIKNHNDENLTNHTEVSAITDKQKEVRHAVLWKTYTGPFVTTTQE